MKKTLFLALGLLALLPGCGPSSSRTVDARSTGFSNLPDKQAFLETYVTFNRTYHQLEFHIQFQDGSDGVLPSPSEWDIRIFAHIPENEQQQWIDGLTKTDPPETEWINTIPNPPPSIEGFSWYTITGKTVGIHETENLILYRAWAF